MFGFPTDQATLAPVGTNVPDRGRGFTRPVIQTNHRSGFMRPGRMSAPDRLNRHPVFQFVHQVEHARPRIVPKFEMQRSVRRGFAHGRRIPVRQARRASDRSIRIVPDFNPHGVHAFGPAMNVRIGNVFFFLVRLAESVGRARNNKENRQWAAKNTRRAKET